MVPTDDEKNFDVSLFDRKTDNEAKPACLTWRQICEMFESPDVRFDKDGRAFSPATFEPNIRAKANVKNVSMLIYDIDHNANLDEIHSRIATLDCAYIVGSTHSHLRRVESNPQAEPRFRVVIPLANPVDCVSFAELWQEIANRLALPIDEAAKDAGRMYYKPAHVLGMPYYHKIVPGVCLDWSPTVRQATAPLVIERAKSVGDVINNGKRNATLTSLAGSMQVRGMAPAAMLAGLLVENKAKCNPPLDDGEVAKIVKSVQRYAPGRDLNSQISLNSHSAKAKTKPRLSDEALHGPAGDAVRILAPHTEASSAAILVQLLAAYGIFIGRGPHFKFGRDVHYTKLNAVLVGPSGTGRKGTAWAEAKAIMMRVDETFQNILVSGMSTGEGLINHVRDAQYKAAPIKESGRIIGYQQELVDSGSTEKRAFAQESEFSRVLKVAGRDGNTLSEVIRDGFDRDSFSVLTKSNLKATGVQFGFVAHITEFELLREMDDTAKANGFGNRILWIYTERSKILPLGGDFNEARLDGVVKDIRSAVEFAQNVGEMKRTPAADVLWCEMYEALSSGNEGMIEALTSRGTAFVMRLACIYALLDRSYVIEVEHLKAALAVWQFAFDSACYIFGDSLGDKVADTIVGGLTDNPEGMTRTEISNLLGRHQKAMALTAALSRLERLGRVGSRQEKTGGATSTVYFLRGELSEICELSTE